MQDQLINKEKIKTEQNVINSKDMWFLGVPNLETEIKQEFEQEKMNNMKTILIACIITKFGIYLCYTVICNVYTDVTKQNLSNSSLLTWIIYFSISIFSQGSIGFSIDLFSLQAAWIFTQFISIIAIGTSILAQQISNPEIIVFGLYITRFCQDCNYVCGSFILYDSQYALDKRFNNAGLFIIIGSFGPQLLVFIFSLLPIDLEVQQLGLLVLSIILNFFGGLIVLKSYNKIDQIRKKSERLKKNKVYRGVGISFRSIINYYWNENIFYLLVILIVNSFLTTDLNNELYADILQQNNQNNFLANNLERYLYSSEIFSVVVFIYPLLKWINSSKNLIIRNYRSITIFMVISFVFKIFESLPFYFLYCFYVVIVILDATICVTVAVICNQLLICLQVERCFIKGIGLGIFGVAQDLTKILFITSIQPIVIFLIQAEIIIITLVYHFYYLKNRDFTELQSKVLNQKQISRNENIIQL